MKLSVARLKHILARATEAPFAFLLLKSWLISFSFFIYPFIKIGVHKLFRLIYKEKICSALERGAQNIVNSKFKLADEELIVLARRVDEVLRGRYQCLGYGYVKICGAAWRRDCIHGVSWPDVYFTKVDFLDAGRRSDIKIVWEKSRLQFLTEIALLVINSCETDQKDLVKLYMKILRDWTLNNRFCQGPNWVVAMEVAIRAANLIFSTYILWRFFSKEERAFIASVLSDHRIFLKWFPEISDIEGNHSLANHMGNELFKIMLASPGSINNNFYKYARKQFSADGFHIEFSPTYHRLCLEIIAVVYISMAVNKVEDDIFQELKGLLVLGLKCCHKISIVKEILPLFGDNDSGHVFNFGQSARDFSALSGVLTQEVTALGLESRISTKFLQGFLSLMTKERNTSLQQNLCSEVTALEPFAIIKTRNAKLICRIGRFGLKERAPHDHDDNLSFVLAAFGKEIVVDSGCPPYTLDSNLREQAIGSLAHNVVQKASTPRSKFSHGSIFKTVKGAPIAAVTKMANNEIIGLMRFNDSSQIGNINLHQRSYKLYEVSSKVELLIEDEISYKELVGSEHRIHFSPDVSLSLSNGIVTGTSGELSFVLDFEYSDGLVLDIHVGSYNYFDAYGCSLIAPNLIVLTNKVNEYKLSLRLSLNRAG